MTGGKRGVVNNSSFTKGRKNAAEKSRFYSFRLKRAILSTIEAIRRGG